jgi:SARP family transcriptional regulator, regulator of embCAB operon
MYIFGIGPSGSVSDEDQWSLGLIGSWRLRRGIIDHTPSRRQQRLIALLALQGPMPRSTAAGILWPEASTKQASGSLRVSLCQASMDLPGVLVVEVGRVALAPDVRVDVRELRQQLSGTFGIEGAVAIACSQVLCHGEVLPGWYDDWVLEAQDEWRTVRMQALQQLAWKLFRMNDMHGAVEAARSAMQIDPLNEEAQRLAMQAQLAEGNYAEALRGYKDFSSRYREELGVAPSRRLTDLLVPVLRSAERSTAARLAS